MMTRVATADMPPVRYAQSGDVSVTHDAPDHSQQLATAVERGDTPGVVALVVDREGILYEGAAGKLDVGKGVITKPVTITVRGESFVVEAPKASNTDKLVGSFEQAKSGSAAPA